jgi:hypothetical protein
MDIVAALDLLDHENDDHWTEEGLPRVDVVNDLLGGDEQVTRQDIKEAAPKFMRLKSTETVNNEDDDLEDLTEGKETTSAAVEVGEKTIGVDEEVDIMNTPVSEIIQCPKLTALGLERLHVEIMKLTRQKDQIGRDIDQLSAQVQLLDSANQIHNRNKQVSNNEIQQYLDSQRKAREAAAVRAQRFIDAGTTAGDVANLLDGRSELDKARSSAAKNKRGRTAKV